MHRNLNHTVNLWLFSAHLDDRLQDDPVGRVLATVDTVELGLLDGLVCVLWANESYHVTTVKARRFKHLVVATLDPVS